MKGVAFGALLRSERKRNGYTQGMLAKHLKVSVPYLSDVENSKRAPFHDKRLKAIVALFGGDVEDYRSAAAITRGYFLLSVTGVSAKHLEVGALLVQRWHALSVGQLDAILSVVVGVPHAR